MTEKLKCKYYDSIGPSDDFNVEEGVLSITFAAVIISPTQRTPLHIAAEGGHVNTVKSLVNNRADINIKDNDGVRLLTRVGYLYTEK